MSQSNTHSNSPSHSVYEQVIHATKSGIKVSESQAQTLQGKPPVQHSNQQSESIVLQEGAQHRVDQKHDMDGHNHMELRLQKFLKLSARYVNTNDQKTTNEVEPQADSQTQVQERNWTEESRNRVVGYQLDQLRERATQALPKTDETQSLPATRIDQPENRALPHFQPAPQTQTDQSIQPSGMIWEAECLSWPEVVLELISDPSLAIDKLGSNTSRLMTGEQNRLLVTASNRGEGVTTLTLSLALWAGSMGKKVLVVDADLANAGLTRAIGLDGNVSWNSAINQVSKLGQAIVKEQKSGIHVMPLSAISDRANMPSDIYGELGKMLNQISDCFDLVLIDVGPNRQLIQETGRVDLLGDATLLIQDVSRTLNDEFAKTKSKLLTYGCTKMLVAENFTK